MRVQLLFSVEWMVQWISTRHGTNTSKGLEIWKVSTFFICQNTLLEGLDLFFPRGFTIIYTDY